MSRIAKKKHFATEAALCAAFIEVIDKRIWVPYPETGSWDILLHRKMDGFQIGIQAKLRMGTDVINQILEGRYATAQGPDCRAVLVPESTGGFGRIAAYIGFEIIAFDPVGRYDKPTFYPVLPSKPEAWNPDNWHEWHPTKRCKLPEYVPDVAAGVPSPVQLTEWKIGAIKIAITMERRGYVTREDFKHIRIDHRRWTARESGWLTVSRDGRWTPGVRFPNVKKQHPKNYAQIEADSDKWMLASDKLTTQEKLI